MPNSTPETMDFLKAAHAGPLIYERLCLRLARMARGIDSKYDTALTAQKLTPESHRIKWADVRKGHIAYFDNPGDSNTAGHVATCAGRTQDGRKLWWTNDAKRRGGVDIVADPSTETSWFGAHWGSPFVYGADWVNGVAFQVGHDDPPKPEPPEHELNELVKDAVKHLRKAAANAKDNGHPKRAEALLRDVERLKKRYNLD